MSFYSTVIEFDVKIIVLFICIYNRDTIIFTMFIKFCNQLEYSKCTDIELKIRLSNSLSVDILYR